jgi:micrococcal nuclease
MKVLKKLGIIGTMLVMFLGSGCSDTSSKDLQKQNNATKNIQLEEKDKSAESLGKEDVTSKEKEAVEEQRSQENKSDNTPDKSSNEVKSPIKLETVVIARVVDGDTFELKDGRKVRLVGVNTPESTTRTEPYGKIASDYTKKQLTGKTVYLEKDVSDTDQYGRSLRIAWISPPSKISEAEIRSKMYNAALVLGGYAEPSTYPPDVKYASYFRKFAEEARKAKKGLWSIDPVNGTTKGDLDKAGSSSTTPKPAPAPTQKQTTTTGKIKGNINSKGEKIYHVPGGEYYDKTVAEELFNTEADAKAAGYRKSKR